MSVARRPEAAAGPHRPRQDEEQLHEPVLRAGEGERLRQEGRRAAESPTRPTTASTSRNGDVLIAAITSCTNTSNPGVLLAAGLLAKKAVGARPHGEAAHQDLARAGLARGHRVPDQARACCPTSRSSASTSPATAAPPASATPGRSRSRSRKPSSRTSWSAPRCCRATANFEARIHPNIRANFLASPPLRGGVRDRRIGFDGLQEPNRSANRRTGRTSSSATSGRPPTRISALMKLAMDAPTFRSAVRRPRQRQPAVQEDLGAHRPGLQLADVQPTSPSRPSSRISACSPARPATSPAPRCWACSATR